MDGAHLHLILNHVPLFGILFGVIVLTFGVWKDDISLQKAGLFTFIATAVITIAVFVTGGEAEHIIEQLPNADEKLIHAHEEAADSALWVTIAIGLLSSFLIYKRKLGTQAIKKWLIALIAINLLLVGYLGYVNNLGGQILHQEIRTGNQ